jgi:hypothetical protein
VLKAVISAGAGKVLIAYDEAYDDVDEVHDKTSVK